MLSVVKSVSADNRLIWCNHVSRAALWPVYTTHARALSQAASVSHERPRIHNEDAIIKRVVPSLLLPHLPPFGRRSETIEWPPVTKRKWICCSDLMAWPILYCCLQTLRYVTTVSVETSNDFVTRGLIITKGITLGSTLSLVGSGSGTQETLFICRECSTSLCFENPTCFFYVWASVENISRLYRPSLGDLIALSFWSNPENFLWKEKSWLYEII